MNRAGDKRRASARRTSRWATAALPFALVVAVVFTLPTAAASAKPHHTGKRDLRALVVNEAHSPIIGALKRRLGKRATFRKDRSVRPGKAKRFNLLVVDGDNLSPNRMASSKRITGFVSSHRWVLGLDLDPGHHRKAIEPATGFSAGRPGGHHSEAFLFTQKVINGTPTFFMLDAERLLPAGTGKVGKRRHKALVRKEADRVARLIVGRVGASRSKLAALSAKPATPGAARAQGAAIDGSPLHIDYLYSTTASAHPPDGRYPEGSTPNQTPGIKAPKPGYQTASWVFNHRFDVYLDNDGHKTGDFQVVVYSVNGQFSPKKADEQFFHMDDPWDGKQWERAWWTGLITPSVKPDQQSEAKLRWQDNEPKTSNDHREQSSEQGFDIGFSGSNEGVEATASYHYSVGQSFDIPDWGLVSTTSGNDVSWEYSSRNGCDARSQSYAVSTSGNCFDYTFGHDGMPNRPNNLSLTQNTIAGSARWTTLGPKGTPAVLGSGQGQLIFDVNDPVTLVDTYCSEFGLFACAQGDPDSHHLDYASTGPGSSQYTIDVSDVLPRPFEALKLPNKAIGGQHQQVTGTVSLGEKAPSDTSVFVYSDSTQAKIVDGAPVTDKMTRKEVVIPMGQTQANFQISTNDNNLKGGHWTATITAFYAGEAHTQDLCVVETASQSCTS